MALAQRAAAKRAQDVPVFEHGAHRVFVVSYGPGWHPHPHPNGPGPRGRGFHSVRSYASIQHHGAVHLAFTAGVLGCCR
jgi:hypothetical protein